MSALQRALDRIEELEELLGISESDAMLYRRALRLDPDSARVLGFIVARRGRIASKDNLFTVLYGARPEAEWPQTSNKIIEVRIHGIRKALRPLGVEIETVVGEGYYITPAHRTRLMAFLHGQANQMDRPRCAV